MNPVVAFRTRAYLRAFLAPARKGADYSRYLKRICSTFMLDQAEISATIREMPYRQFVSTIYWAAISAEVKRRHGHRCAWCKLTARWGLETHHWHYRYHGFEHLKYRDRKFLQPLCRGCHAIVTVKGTSYEEVARTNRVRRKDRAQS